MKTIELIVRTVIQLVKVIIRLPRTIADAVGRRQQRIILHELETERLDRIRNPEKYRGK